MTSEAFDEHVFLTCRSGSVVATLEMKFGKSVNEPLTPLKEAIKDGKLGSFTVNRDLDMNPSKSRSI